jgi:hypothetical protein
VIGWLFAAGAAILLAGTRRCWAPGDGPFDVMPPGVASPKLSVYDSKSKDGARSYKVHAFARGSQFYAVCVRADNKDWLGYLHEPSTNARMLFRANAGSPTALEQIRKDFDV